MYKTLVGTDPARKHAKTRPNGRAYAWLGLVDVFRTFQYAELEVVS